MKNITIISSVIFLLSITTLDAFNKNETLTPNINNIVDEQKRDGDVNSAFFDKWILTKMKSVGPSVSPDIAGEWLLASDGDITILAIYENGLYKYVLPSAGFLNPDDAYVEESTWHLGEKQRIVFDGPHYLRGDKGEVFVGGDEEKYLIITSVGLDSMMEYYYVPLN